MRPTQDLPIDDWWQSTDEYVESLLHFVSTSELFRNLCGGVHILDFLTRKPDLYSWVLPQEWRDWFEFVEVEEVLDLMLREDLEQIKESASGWRGKTLPPNTLVQYISTIRRLSLKRGFSPRKNKHGLEFIPRHISVGMRPKKIHEVSQFAAFVDELSQNLSMYCKTGKEHEPAASNGSNSEVEYDSEKKVVSPTIIDFGSGQNYLGRTLACHPYNRQVIAIEQRHHNVEGARGMDISAKLANREKKAVNKKEFKQQWEASRKRCTPRKEPAEPTSWEPNRVSQDELDDLASRVPLLIGEIPEQASVQMVAPNIHAAGGKTKDIMEHTRAPVTLEAQEEDQHSATGRILYVEKELSSERLGPPTFKLPTLRSNHPRLEATSSAFDPHGFPMSKRLEEYTYPISTMAKSIAKNDADITTSKRYYNLNGNMQEIDATGRGVRLNITARMMAVQAPHNWGPKDSQEFFSRHYYRALLQRILLDLDVVKMSTPASTPDIEIAGGTLSGKDETGRPLIIGSLRKACFANFEAYVPGAIEKLVQDPVDGPSINQKTKILLEDGGELIRKYEHDYFYAKKHLSLIWSLMAFSANVVESTILVDRWLWLKEQDMVEDAWIESVFDYKQSPRNMVVVGIKKRRRDEGHGG